VQCSNRCFVLGKVGKRDSLPEESSRVPPEVHAAVECVIGRALDPHEILPRAKRRASGQPPVDVFHDGRHLVVKAFREEGRAGAAEREFAALRLVEGLDLAPKPVFFDPAVGPVVVYEYLEGTMWDRRVPSATELGALAEASPSHAGRP